MKVLRTLLWLASGTLWFFLVFTLGFWLTFPSAALGQFARWQLQESSPDLRLDVDGISPSGFGLRADNLVLSKKERSTFSQMVAAEHVYLSSGPWSLLNLAVLGGKGTIYGSVARDSGDLSFSAVMSVEEGQPKLHATTLDAEGLPLSAMPEIGGARLTGRGGIDVHVDLHGSEGLAKSDGRVKVQGSDDLVIEKIDAPGTQLDGLSVGEVAISQLDLDFEVKNGKGKVTTGQILTDLANIEVQGDFTLSDNLPMSRLRLKLLISLNPEFDKRLGVVASVAKGLLGQPWADGAYHYAINGTVSAPRPRAERERKARPSPASNKVEGPAPDDNEAEVASPPADGDADERAKRRESAIAERRARMEERRKQLQSGGMAAPKRPGALPIMPDLPMPADEDLPPGVEEDLPPGLEDPLDPGEEF